MAPLCKFYQQGTCRNGANCRFEHPGANNSNPFGSRPNNNANPFGSASSSSNANPFGAASNNNNNRFGAFGSGAGNNANRPDDNPWKITKESIEIDLARERPTWILSCYGPGRDAPEQLFGGPDREQSLEEARLFVMSQPDPQAAYGKIQALYQQAEQQMQSAVANLDGAMQFLLAGEAKHPNRHDICKQSVGRQGGYSPDASQPPAPSSNPFGKPAGATTSAFGQPSIGAQPSAFGGGGGGGAIGGTGAFGSSAPAAAAPAFGQPTAAAAAPAFGQPAAFGAKASPWGSASAGAAVATPAFGQSSFGQPAQSTAGGSAFGQPSQIGTTSAFGQPSTLGAKPNPFGGGGSSTQSPFGQPAQTSTTGAFGQPAQPATTSAFGQPSALGQKPNPFGAQAPAAAPSAFGQPAASSPFGQPAPAAQGMNGVQGAQQQPAASNPFGQPAGGGFASAAAATTSPFGQKPGGFGTATTPAANPFGQPQPAAQPSQPAASVASTPGATGGNPYGPNSQKQHPPLESYVTKQSTGQLATFRGQPVGYKFRVGDKYMDALPEGGTLQQNPPAPGIRNQDGSWRRVLFPFGAPGYNKDTEPDDPAKYTPQVKAAYEISAARGMFEGDMPECPPMREDCVWNF
ncbi:uncharacterized protein B0I36DRAFT_126330 [Microdochium trichocladiopsis]|uniref:C3H1-type domain-containing protein n=1 Tax=Microdochium trichocladiopsis TaxID=1682393 RepID=A0A9P9BP14_9PEZI|nr:uncharacterized protein B0I36DRAFT_126330 [Microdochium trichocladiopsis]KAH7028809.1 hypothetical protein B0I36DRAFT_126330 [Microdochium trichocladiopsis]